MPRKIWSGAISFGLSRWLNQKDTYSQVRCHS
jgi:hypothetical protein